MPPILPPVNVPRPTYGSGPSFNLGPPTQQPATPPPSGGTGGGGGSDPGTVEGRIAIRNQIRERLMNDEIRGLLTKQATGGLSPEEAKKLQEWEDQVEVEYSHTINIAVPTDVQARIQRREELANQQNEKSRGGSGGGGRSGGGASRGSGGASSGGARPSAGTTGARSTAGAAGRPAAGATTAAQGRNSIQRSTATAPTTTATARPAPGILRQAIEGLYRERGATMTPEGYKKAVGVVANLLAKGGKPDPNNPDEQDAAAVLRRVAVNGWLRQLREHGTGEGGVSPAEVQSLVDAGAINPDGSIKNGRAFTAMLQYADQHPEANINTFVNSWTAAVANGEGVTGAREVTSELRGQGATLPPGMAATPTEPTPTQPTPTGVPEGSLQLHPNVPGQDNIWVAPDNHVYALRDGQLTDLDVQDGAFQIAQSRNQPTAPATATAPAQPTAGTTPTTPPGGTGPTIPAPAGLEGVWDQRPEGVPDTARMYDNPETNRREWITPDGSIYIRNTRQGDPSFGDMSFVGKDPAAYQAAADQAAARAAPAAAPTGEVPPATPPGEPAAAAAPGADTGAPTDVMPRLMMGGTAPRVLDNTTPDETWTQVAQAAWDAQRRQDELTGERNLDPNEVAAGRPSAEYIQTWKNWYQAQRDAGNPPDIQNLVQGVRSGQDVGPEEPPDQTPEVPPSLGPPVVGEPNPSQVPAFNATQEELLRRFGNLSGGGFNDPVMNAFQPPQQVNEDGGIPVDMGQTYDENGNPTSSGPYDVEEQALPEIGGRRRRGQEGEDRPEDIIDMGDGDGSDSEDGSDTQDEWWRVLAPEEETPSIPGMEAPSDGGDEGDPWNYGGGSEEPSDGGEEQPSDGGSEEPSDGGDEEPSDGGDEGNDGGDEGGDGGDEEGDDKKKEEDPGEDPGGPVGYPRGRSKRRGRRDRNERRRGGRSLTGMWR